MMCKMLRHCEHMLDEGTSCVNFRYRGSLFASLATLAAPGPRTYEKPPASGPGADRSGLSIQLSRYARDFAALSLMASRKNISDVMKTTQTTT